MKRFFVIQSELAMVQKLVRTMLLTTTRESLKKVPHRI